jgi:threonine aldolase
VNDRPGPVDLRSDTVTTPTPAMRAAMAAAEVGDDGYGEDPTVRRLEERAAAEVGTEAALFVVSGTMANQLAVGVLARPGTEVCCPARAHVRRYEHGALAANLGLQVHPLDDPDGRVDPQGLREVLRGAGHDLPPVGAVMIENTHMVAGGVPLPPAHVTAVAAAAAEGGVPLHCDGARLFNAAVATGCDPRRLVQGCTTVAFCFSKGLAAPVGSVLCGPTELIGEARRLRARLGGGWRQAGVVAAAALVALEEMVPRLAEDHRRARVLAEVLADRFPGSVDASAVRTNIVCARADALPDRFVGRLAEGGVLAGTIDPHTVRLVTHTDVDDAALARAREVIDGIARHPGRGGAGR